MQQNVLFSICVNISGVGLEYRLFIPEILILNTKTHKGLPGEKPGKVSDLSGLHSGFRHMLLLHSTYNGVFHVNGGGKP